MGLLDDAIREHLELKRLHGADASEVARQEHEALGPVVRGELATPVAAPPPFDAAPDFADEAPTTVQTATPPAPEDPPTTVAAPEPPPAPVLPPAPPAAPADAPPPSQSTVAFSLADIEAASAGVPQAPAAAPVPPVDAPAPPAAPEAVRPSSAPVPPPADVPVQELAWDAPATPPPAPEVAPVARDVVPADEEPGEHDELEETPEFLQETPEHDRLWFEQKPPRDFDF